MQFRFWLFAVGNTLCFAVILAKQWRVYYIFSNPTPNKMVHTIATMSLMIANVFLFQGGSNIVTNAFV
jgi:hypothetical protein